MQLFTENEYQERYNDSISLDLIEQASDMIFAQCSPMYRTEWTSDDVPTEIKRACLVQAKFLNDFEIPSIDYKSKVEVGEMKAELSSHYSTFALTILANNGYQYRGSLPNFTLNIGLGD